MFNDTVRMFNGTIRSQIKTKKTFLNIPMYGCPND